MNACRRETARAATETIARVFNMTAVNRNNDAGLETCVVKSDLRETEIPKRRIIEAVEREHFDENAVFAIKLALEEALTNAVKHGNACDPNKKVTVRFAVNQERAVIIVRDEGSGFEPSQVPDPTRPDRLRVPNGRGIMLLRAYMDEIDYRDQGRELYMVKRRLSKRPS